MRNPQLRLLALAGLAALLVLATWFSFGSAVHNGSPSELEDAIAEQDVKRAPALIAPSEYVRREDSAVADAIDGEGTSTRFDPGDLVVRFIDAEGEPVSDLRAVLKVELAKHDERGSSQRHHSIWAPQDDVPRHGIRIPSTTLASAFAKAREAQAEGHEVRLFVSPAFTTPACTSYLFSKLEKPAADIELRLEGSGFVRVEALEPNGDPSVHDLNVMVMIARSSTESNRPDESTRPHHSQQIGVADPRVRVPLGEYLFVEVRDRGHNFHRHRETIEGPISEGHEVLLRFTLCPYAYLVGRLISLEGEPVRDHKYWASVHVLGNGLSMEGGRTDAEGRFRVKIFRDPPPKQLTQLIIHPIESDQHQINTQELEYLPKARLTDIDVPESGERDLGDVQLGPPDISLLASGVVVDGLGQPVAAAQVTAYSVWPPKHHGPWEDWEYLDDAPTKTNAQGEFRILSKKSCRALRLNVAKPGLYMGKGITAEVGRTDVRLVLRVGTTITGSVLWPEGFPTRSIFVVRVPEQGNPEYQSINAEGGFRFAACRPGVHEIRVELQPQWTLHQVPAVVVGGEQALLEPRLQRIDLRSRLKLLQLRVLDSSGTSLGKKGIRLSQADDAERVTTTETDATGIVRIVLPVEIQSLAVSIPGGIPQVVHWRHEVQELRLLEPIKLELGIESPPDVPEGIFLNALLTLDSAAPLGTDPKLLLPCSCSFFSTTGVCHVPVAGTYRVAWSVSTNTRSFEFEASAVQLIHVLAGDSVQRLRVDLPLDGYRAAIQRLGR